MRHFHTEADAVDYAATWGSYMRAGDPGTCMYGFSPKTGIAVQSEDHRERCLAYIEKCKGMVDPEDNDDHDEDDLDKLDELADMIRGADIAHA